MANTGKVFAALLLGAAAGAVIGVLYAPDKGSATRKKMAGKASELGDGIKQKFTRSGDGISDIKDRMAGRAEELRNSHTH